MKYRLLILTIVISLFAPMTSLAQIACLDVEGEALIVNNDKPAAKMEAIARAKWSAIEQSR